MKNGSRLIWLLLLIMAAPLLANTIYKTVKPDGTVVYSDVPSPDSIPVNFVQDNNVVIPSLADPLALKPELSDSNKIKTHYKVTVLSPSPEETIRNNNGEVFISFEISPEYLGKFYLLLDNQLVNTKGKTQIRLNNVERGEHSIEVQLRDNSGKIFASSQKQTFYLHQASALINAN
jgi:hypothetical protein